MILSAQIILSNIALAQINGISGSKLCVSDPNTVEKGKFEFEPSISVFRSSKKFDTNWKLTNLHGNYDESSLFFRITLGVANNLEVGTSFSTNLDDIFIGSKAKLLSINGFSVAIIGGLSLPTDNKTIIDTINIPESKHSFSIGSVTEITLTENSNIDLLFSYTRYNGKSQFENSLNYGAAVGYWFTSTLQGVIELDGYTTFNNSIYSDKLSLTPGITFNFSKNLLLVLGLQSDIWGKNDFSGTNIFNAFTMSF